MECLDDTTVLQWTEGSLSPENLTRVMEHLDGCQACRQLLAAMAVAEDANTVSLASTGGMMVGGADQWPTAFLPEGTSVGRYVIEQKIAAGGMGVVYAAHDPGLDRHVAIKFEKTHTGEPPATRQARISAEARAMARLQHPNVVAVHDVGLFHGEMFVAMDLVDGVNLRAWLQQEPRAQRAILETFVHAGRGLAAAHQAGLAHGDFKPENVLVSKSGRVLVTDFGFTHSVEEASNASFKSGTKGGGTPRYMAPEQKQGLLATPLSDQFSYCVALREALQGTTTAPLRSARLTRLLEQGLSTEPAQRHPNMPVLLAQLERCLRPMSTSRWIAVGACVCLLGVGAWLFQQRRNQEAECDAQVALVDQTWSSTRQAAVATGFAAIQRPYAQTALDAVNASLSSYVAQWRDAAHHACQDAVVNKTVAWNTWQAQRECLDRARHHLASVVEMLSHPDENVVQHATQVGPMLLSVEDCGLERVQRFSEGLPSEEEPRKKAEMIHRDVARADALLQAGRLADAGDLAQQSLESSRTLMFSPVEMGAHLQLGMTLHALGKFLEARKHLQEAILLAETLGHEETAIRGWISLVGVWRDLGDSKQGRDALGHAKALATRIPLNAPWFTRLATGEAHLLSDEGAWDITRQVGEAALRRMRDMPDYLPSHEAMLHNVLGTAESAAGHGHEARAHYRQALERMTAEKGPRHPGLAGILLNLAYAEAFFGSLGEALRITGQAQEVIGASMDGKHPLHSVQQGVMAELEREAGLLDASLRSAQASLGMCLEAYGPRHWRCANAYQDLGLTLLEMGRWDESEHQLTEALNAYANSENLSHVRANGAHWGLAMIQLRRRRLASAQQHVQHALEAGVNTAHVILRARIHATAARVAHAQRKMEDAVKHAREANAAYAISPPFARKEAGEFARWAAGLKYSGSQ